jgi:TonB family protein
MRYWRLAFTTKAAMPRPLSRSIYAILLVACTLAAHAQTTSDSASPAGDTHGPILVPVAPSREGEPPQQPCNKLAYPSDALRLEQVGTTTLVFQIDADGAVKGAHIAKSSGYRSLDHAARTGLAKCTFLPATDKAKPIDASIQLQYVWNLQ